VIERKGHGKAVDWWGLGMITYELLTGVSPWSNKNTEALYRDILSAPLIFPRSVTKLSAIFIRSLLTRDVSKRLGSKGVDEIRHHYYFSEIDWFSLYDQELPPPFIPCFQTDEEENAINFDEEFKQLPIDPLISASATTDENTQLQSEENDRLLLFTYEENQLDHRHHHDHLVDLQLLRDTSMLDLEAIDRSDDEDYDSDW
jgi:serine/threonine protein kinase